MKKNIICILIDCFDYNRIGKTDFRPSATPFLDTLKDNSFWAEKMYSQAPFTEGAMMATHCGYDTMDHGGYLKRYKDCPETIFEMMHRGGYQVYAQMWPHFHPSSAVRGIDSLELRANSFGALWAYRLQYFAQIFQEGAMEEADFKDLEELVGDNLQFWLQYDEMLISGDPRVSMSVNNIILPPLEKDIQVLRQENLRFREDPRGYVQELLTAGKDHVLFTLYDNECLDNKVPKEFVKKIAGRYAQLNQRIYHTGNRLNRKNNRPSLRAMVDYFRRSEQPWDLRKRTQFSQYLRNYYQITHQQALLKRIGPEYDMVKDCVSLRTMMQMFLDWEEGREDTRPYFAYIHNDDIHGPSAFFDYCSTDEQEIAASMDSITQHLDALPGNYRGNLGYDLGVLNVDRQIRWFYNELQRKGMLEDTVFIITSDHGCGTNYDPIRGFVQNFHDECYHVPFIVCGSGIVPTLDSEFRMTKDLMPTLAHMAEIEPPKSATGVSVFVSAERSYVHQEYMGPGCPDLYRRPIWMCAFDERWKVFIKVRLCQESFQFDLEEIYDLRMDPQEKCNLRKNEQAQTNVQHLLDVLEQRWAAIRADYHRG